MPNKEKVIEYSANNSGGDWWLKDRNWKDLENGGWLLERTPKRRKGDPLARKAYRKGLSLKVAIAEWSELTGLDPYEIGCPCCGPPHGFYEYTSEEVNSDWFLSDYIKRKLNKIEASK